MPDATPTEAPPEMSVAEASTRYEGEWVLLKATRVDEHQRITHGVVVDHHRDRKQLSKSLRVVWKDEPGARVWIFLGGLKMGTGEELYAELRRGLEQAARDDYVNVNW